MGLLSNETVNATASEVFKLGGLSSEQLLSGNFCTLVLYSLISSWQHLWTNTQDNRLQAVKPCVLVWHSSSFDRKEEVMLTCLQIRHSCLTHMLLLQGATIYTYTVWCAHPEWVPMLWQLPNFPWSRNVAWHPRWWLTWVCSRCQGGCLYLTDSVLFYCSLYMYYWFRGFTRPYTACPTVIS
jgi:hypothetical protein